MITRIIIVCASTAAKTNLTERFTKNWKLKLDEKVTAELNKIDSKEAAAAKVLEEVSA